MGFFAPILGIAGGGGGGFIGAISTISKIAGTISKVMGSKGGAESQANMYAYNQRVAEQNAAQIRRASLAEQSARRDEMRRFLSKRQAKYAAAGVTMAGSPLETQLETIAIYEEDIGNLTWEYDIEAQRQQSRANIEGWKAEDARRGGKIGVGQALISGVGAMAKMGLRSQLS